MTKEQRREIKIKRILEYAKGFDKYDWNSPLRKSLVLSGSEQYLYGIIFDIDFLKAYFGKEWNLHAQQLVLKTLDDKIKYLYEFILPKTKKSKDR